MTRAQARKHRKSSSLQLPPSILLGSVRTPHLYLAPLRAQKLHSPVRACKRTASPCVNLPSPPPQHEYPLHPSPHNIHSKNRSLTDGHSQQTYYYNNHHYNSLVAHLRIF